MLREILKLPFAETVFGLDKRLGGSRRRAMLRPDLKPFYMMRHAFWEFLSRGCMVLDPFFETGTNTKASLLEPKHLEFTGWEADRRCVAKMMPSILQEISQ